jgi:hypothetical protein
MTTPIEEPVPEGSVYLSLSASMFYGWLGEISDGNEELRAFHLQANREFRRRNQVISLYLSGSIGSRFSHF